MEPELFQGGAYCSRIWGMLTIALYLIVKNEAERLPSLLDSIGGTFDEIVLCDTGSTDDTVLIFDEWAINQQIDRKVVHFEWCDDFGAARQYALEQVDSNWAVWCDADDSCDGIDSLRAAIEAMDDAGFGAAMMPYFWTPTFSGHLMRATRRGASRWSGRRHESQTVTGKVATLDGPVWRTNRASGTRDALADIAALRADIQDDPANARAQFYVAQTYKDIQAWPEALEAYDSRVAMGGWDQEVYYSRYMAAVIAAEMEDPSWIHRFIAAHEFRPHRAEAPYELARRLRVAGAYHAALAIALSGLEHRRDGDVLFVHTAAGDWGLQFEASICCYWVGDYRGCICRSKNLLQRQDVPGAYRDALQLNIQKAQAKLSA